MKKILFLFLSIVVKQVFAQTNSFKIFSPKDYPVVYFGSTTQTIKSDPYIGKVLSPTPYDRFFYLWIYNDDNKQKVIAYGYKEFDAVDYAKKSGQQPAAFTFVNFTKMPLPAGSADAKPPYTLYQLLIPPLGPSGKYQYVGFYTMTEGELKNVRDALLLIDLQTASHSFTANAVDPLLKNINDNKKIQNDGTLISAAQTKIYYDEKIAPLLTGVTSLEQKADIILNMLHKDISVNEAYVKDPGTGNFILTPTKDPLPVFFDIKPLYNVDFTPMTVDARTSFTTTVDAGYVVFGFPPDQFIRGSAYLGLDFYFRPFDPDIPFRYVRKYSKFNFADRLSFNFGITLNSQAKQYYRADLWGSKNVMAGFGIRLNNILKLNTGALMYYKLDPNFLIDNKKLAFTPYVGASIDIRIGTIFKSFSSLFSL